jgi:hypothetical protein
MAFKRVRAAPHDHSVLPSSPTLHRKHVRIGQIVSHRLAAIDIALALTYFSHPEECEALVAELKAKYPKVQIKSYKVGNRWSPERSRKRQA